MPTKRNTGSDSPRNRVFTPPYFKAEAVRKSSRQLQALLGKNHLLFVVDETYHIFIFSSFVFSLCNSQDQPMSTAQRPPKSTTEKVPGPDVTGVRPSSSSGRTTEVMFRRVAALRKVRRKTTLTWRIALKKKWTGTKKNCSFDARVVSATHPPAHVWISTRGERSLLGRPARLPFFLKG